MAALAAAGQAAAAAPRVEVVVTLDAPPLARAVAASRVLTDAAKRRRLKLGSPTSAAYLNDVAARQRILETRIRRTIPSARTRWRYGVVLNGIAVVVPAGSVERLASIPGVASVYPSVRYRRRLDSTPGVIGAAPFWGPELAFGGVGIKIGIIDDGVDHTHPFFAPAGYAAPPGFPRGQTAYTSTKVIVARAFPPPGARWRHAGQAFDREHSVHGTHVAGIAAGNARVPTGIAGRTVSGIAPRAYVGNYKVLTVPTPGVGLNGNAPEIVAGIEAAVRDGMDVINLSLGEPEIEPRRDLVVQAIDGAAAAGVVPVVSAGNDFGEFGRGSISSPGSAEKAVTVAATTDARVLAGFSSSGPAPLSLRLKPDVAAPGVNVLSAVPARAGTWEEFSGTSMAAPHVAGAAALLTQRHPTWTPAQVKAALVLTGDPASEGAAGEAAPTREGGGVVNLARANDPLVFADPPSLSFGLVREEPIARRIALTDAGGGAGTWTVSIAAHEGGGGAVAAPATVTVPGELRVEARAGGAGEHEGFLVLRRGEQLRRIPYWFLVARPSLGRPHATLRRTGTYRGSTLGKPARVATYRYPDRVAGRVVRLAGPEQVFRVVVRRPVANFGVAVVARARGARVVPRVVFAGDENRQVGYTSLPLNLNPYLPTFRDPRLVAGAVLPAPGAYDVVFDAPSRATAGRFTFRFWIDDTSPPQVRLLTPRVRRGRPVAVAVSDRGSGVDPQSLVVSVDGRAVSPRPLVNGRLLLRLEGLAPGRHRLVVQASDYQETRNNENVPRILPNTRRLETRFVVVR